MSKTIEIKVPDIGDFSGIPVIEVLVSAGDQVQAEASLVTLESDKATMEVPAPHAGVITEVKLKVDDTVSEGDVVAVLEISEESNDESVKEVTKQQGSEPDIEAREPAKQKPEPQRHAICTCHFGIPVARPTDHGRTGTGHGFAQGPAPQGRTAS